MSTAADFDREFAGFLVRRAHFNVDHLVTQFHQLEDALNRQIAEDLGAQQGTPEYLAIVADPKTKDLQFSEAAERIYQNLVGLKKRMERDPLIELASPQEFAQLSLQPDN